MISLQLPPKSFPEQSPCVKQDFHASMALAPILSAFLQIQFSRSSMLEDIETHRLTIVTGDGNVAPGMRITEHEADVIDTFVAGLNQSRLELHGPKKSAAIMDVLALAAALNVDDVLDIIEHDIKAFGEQSHQALLIGLTDRDRIFIKSDARALAVMAEAQFSLNVHDDSAESQHPQLQQL